MRRTSKRKLRRIKRGETVAPGRYWLSFMVFSVVVHAVTLTMMSDAALSFLQSLRQPEPQAPQLTYINLFYSTPAPLNPGETPTANAPANVPGVPVHGHAPREARPANHVETKADATPPAMPEDDVLLHVKVRAATKARDEQKPRTLPEPKAHDTAIRETAVLQSADAGTIQLITGTKKTDIKLADIAKQKTEQSEPTVVLNPYSSVRISSPAHAPVTNPAPDVQPDNPAALPMASRRLDNLAQPAQPSATAQTAEATQPVPALSQPTLANSSSVASAGHDIMNSGGKEPLPSPVTAFKTHTSIPPSPAAVTGPPSANNEKAPILSAAAQPVKPPVNLIEAPKPSPPKVITIKGTSENAVKPPKIKITTPRSGTIDKSLIDIAGKVEGDGVKSVTLSIRGDKRELLVRGGAFRTTAQLEEGRNEIRAEAADVEARVVSDSIAVTYVPALTAARISFISPVKDGVIDAMTQKQLLISGVAQGTNIGSVRVYLNKTVMDIELKDGSFRATVPLEAERNMLYAEATDKSGKTCRSEKIEFHVLNLYPKDLTVRMECSGKGGVPALKYRFSQHPLSEKTGQLKAAPEFSADAGQDGGVVSVGEATPGIYTVGVEYDMGPGEVREVTFKVTLYGYDPSRKKTRTIGPARLRGKGFLPAVRVLLPEGVFWEDESWFTGRMESGQGTMKYREPEGIVWKEEEE